MDIIIFGYKPKEMKKLLLLSTFILLSVVGLNAQTWTYANKTSDFDGSYKIVSAYGYGGEFPYQSPRFIVRDMDDRIEIFISDLGYTGCDGNELIIVFDSKRKYYVSTGLLIESTDKDALFIAGIRESWNGEVLTIYHLLDEVKKSSKMSIRFSSDCKTNDFFYKLDGSTSALNKMFGRRIQDEVKSFEENKVKLAIAKKEKERKQAISDSIERIKIDSIASYREKAFMRQKAVKDSLNGHYEQLIQLFLDNPTINGQDVNYTIPEASREKVIPVMTRNIEVLRVNQRLKGFDLELSSQGYYKLMMIYTDDKGTATQSRYLYKSFRLTDTGELIVY